MAKVRLSTSRSFGWPGVGTSIIEGPRRLLRHRRAHPDYTLVREEPVRLYSGFYGHPADTAELIDMLRLGDLRKREFGALSGGQQQRVSIALALVGNPEIAVLDELTTGLDPESRRATWDLVGAIRDRGVTIVLVTHYMDEAEQLCDRLAIIDRGTVVAAGSPGELIAGSDDARYVLHLAEPLSASSASELPAWATTTNGRRWEIAGGTEALSAVLVALDGRGITPIEVETRRPSLEDAFLRFVSTADTPTKTDRV